MVNIRMLVVRPAWYALVSVGERRLIMAADMRPRKHSTPLLEVVHTLVNTARSPAWNLVRDRRARPPYAPWHQHTPTPLLIPGGDHGRCQRRVGA